MTTLTALSQSTAPAVPTATTSPSRPLAGWFTCMVDLSDGSELRVVSWRETDGTWRHHVPSGSVTGVVYHVTLWLAEMVPYRNGVQITANGDCDCPAGRHGKPCKHLWQAAAAERTLAPELWDIAMKLTWGNSTEDYHEGLKRLDAIRWQPEAEEVA